VQLVRTGPVNRPSLLDTVVANATGNPPDYARVSRLPALDHQSNHLYDVSIDGLHLIAKEYLRPGELPLRLFVSSMR
jgi:hypothetical protein